LAPAPVTITVTFSSGSGALSADGGITSGGGTVVGQQGGAGGGGPGTGGLLQSGQQGSARTQSIICTQANAGPDQVAAVASCTAVR
jgi:hypothetical protein